MSFIPRTGRGVWSEEEDCESNGNDNEERDDNKRNAPSDMRGQAPPYQGIENAGKKKVNIMQTR